MLKEEKKKELKEEDLELPSDTTEDLSIDIATGSSILSESHSTHMYTSCSM